jgi:hypothetical protein
MDGPAVRVPVAYPPVTVARSNPARVPTGATDRAHLVPVSVGPVSEARSRAC